MADGSLKLQALVRSLNLIPYFKNHPDKTPLEAAKDLGMDPGELKKPSIGSFVPALGAIPRISLISPSVIAMG